MPYYECTLTDTCDFAGRRSRKSAARGCPKCGRALEVSEPPTAHHWTIPDQPEPRPRRRRWPQRTARHQRPAEVAREEAP